MKYIFIFAIKCYQLLISPYFPSCCKYYPTCSSYAIEAFKKHSLGTALIMSLKRLCRCHPWSKGGIDFVKEE